MKTIDTNPETVSLLFVKNYVIPEYQRKYTWDKDKCQRLWDDLVYFYDTESEDKQQKYFLGTITVTNVKEDNNQREIVDGQQRIITISLLIKALHHRTDEDGLKACLLEKDVLSDKLENRPRITSLALEKNNEEFENIILSKNNDADPNQLMRDNYELFKNKIEEYEKEIPSQIQIKDIKAFAKFILTQVEFLIISGANTNEALQLFETINDRGTPLNDTDIFKVQLYRRVKESERVEFIEMWNALNDHIDLFIIYMHILRAQNNDTNNTVGLRKYFHQINKGEQWLLFTDWKKVMSILAKLQDIREYNWDIPVEKTTLWDVLKSYPNDYYRYPLYVFLNKYIEDDARHEDTNLLTVTDKVQKDFEELLTETTKYLVIKGLVHKSLDKIKPTIFKVCAAIEKEEDYSIIYKQNLSLGNESSEFTKFKDALKHYDEFGNYGKVIFCLAAFLNKIQSRQDLSTLLLGNFHVEHILPKKWKDFYSHDGWDADNHAQNLNKLGNLLILEGKNNIAAKNYFFKLKKDPHFKTSRCQDAVDLSNEKEDKWTPELLNARDEMMRKRILDFMDIDK